MWQAYNVIQYSAIRDSVEKQEDENMMAMEKIEDYTLPEIQEISGNLEFVKDIFGKKNFQEIFWKFKNM